MCIDCAVQAQQSYSLTDGWLCRKASELAEKGEQISMGSYSLTGWMQADVPGTVLSTLVHNNKVPDPYYGMNNKQIPDIYYTGPAEYTYWFERDFTEQQQRAGGQTFLEFRGVNYSFELYLNGRRVIDQPDSGMFIRRSFNITSFLSADGRNRLAVLVHPPSPVGNPNGGQGGDGTIAHSVTNQYVAGWDWIQPIADRNTGIWDLVTIRKTGKVGLANTHVITRVPGKRLPNSPRQQPAAIVVSTEVENLTDSENIKGRLELEIDGAVTAMNVVLAPHTLEQFQFPEVQVNNPELWWPNGYGPQNMNNLKVRFLINGKELSDVENVHYGIRQITTAWNNKTQSREIRVNGQKIFIKGGNWILSDEMLRWRKPRYDAEVRYHRDMNLNLIRVWGGGITERPEFYDACDQYGLLVMQDFWASGDCNGRWYDTFKKEDTNARRGYPDNHSLFLESVEDQVKMLRNHPSLALWCGGNEIRPPADILTVMRDSLLPQLDGTRYFFEYSNDDSMSLHGGDGPYTIQPLSYYWQHKSFPFNSEIGSVGVGDLESIQRFIPKKNQVVPYYNQQKGKWIIDSVWEYHRYTGYDSAIEAYGHPKDIADFARKAQLVNYDQYRALMEGASAHMWDWYTGIIIWKTQNPWTAMRGQMYDYYLDPNACLFGTAEGAKPVHIMYDRFAHTILTVNNLFKPVKKRVSATVYDVKGTKRAQLNDTVVTLQPGKCQKVPMPADLASELKLPKDSAFFLALTLQDTTNEIADENTYWLPDSAGTYRGLSEMKPCRLLVSQAVTDSGMAITLHNSFGNSPAFFVRVSVINSTTGERELPEFLSDNYVTVMPGCSRKLFISDKFLSNLTSKLKIEGWNVPALIMGLPQESKMFKD